MPYNFFKRLILGLCFLLSYSHAGAEPSKVVNVYNWAYALTPEILQQFEKETGIKVNYDVYDSPEVMETKLFAGHSGYDVVAVTVWPYLSRQLDAHLYQALQAALNPHKAGVDTDLLTRMAEVDPENQFALPYVWGTTGFAFNRKMILERFANAPLQSFAMLFDPSIIAHFADCGVILIDSPIDVFPAILNYLEKNPNSESLEDLELASKALAQVKPFVKKFQALPSARDLILKDYCLVEGYSGELLLAQKLGKENGLDIQYVIPQEGTSLWIDAFAIPQDAPHVPEAHAFINFMLRPDIIAQVTNALETANSVPSSLAFVEKIIKENPLIYPSKETLKKLYVDKTHSPPYERMRLRAWTRVKTGR